LEILPQQTSQFTRKRLSLPVQKSKLSKNGKGISLQIRELGLRDREFREYNEVIGKQIPVCIE
jgi:hypothetical protein